VLFETDLEKGGAGALAIIRPSAAGNSFVGRAMFADTNFTFGRPSSLFLGWSESEFGPLESGEMDVEAATVDVDVSIGMLQALTGPLQLTEPSP